MNTASTSIGERIRDDIIKANIAAPFCPNDPSHNIVVVWSSGAAEQLEAILAKYANELVMKSNPT